MLDSDCATPEEIARCEAWQDADPSHRRTLDRMRALDDRFGGLGAAEREALHRTAAGSRAGMRVGATLAGIAVVALVGWSVLMSEPMRERMADARTATGEQRTLALEDGSGLVLDTATVADTRFNADARTVHLFRGQVLAEVVRDPRRPFVVTTGEGTATALGTAFVVYREKGETRVTVTRSRVRVCTKDAASCTELGAGERARLAGGRLQHLPSVDPESAMIWARGWLEADDMPLGEVLAELNRYRTRAIQFDPNAIGQVRITGSYPLRDTDRALEAIAGSAGLRIEHPAPGEVRLVR